MNKKKEPVPAVKNEKKPEPKENIAQNHIAEKTAVEFPGKAKFADELRNCFTINGMADLLDDVTEDRFYRLLKALVEENAKHNLTAVTEYKKMILLHLCDSLTIVSLIPEGASVLDVGAGAGFPSLPLAIVRPDIKVTSLDSTAKKTGWIAAEADLLGLNNVKTVTGRIEELSCPGTALRGSFDVVTARAVASLSVLSEICIPAVRKGGMFIAMKGSSGKDECSGSEKAIDVLGARLTDVQELEIRTTDGSESQTRINLTFVKTKASHDKYPRAYAQIKKKPLY